MWLVFGGGIHATSSVMPHMVSCYGLMIPSYFNFYSKKMHKKYLLKNIARVR